MINNRCRMETYLPTCQNRAVTVLIIEDERVSRKALARLLAQSGYTAETVASGEEAIEALASGPQPAVVLVDLDLPGMSGCEVLQHLAVHAPQIKGVLVSGAGEERIARIHRLTGVPYLRKPINFNELLSTLDDMPACN